jgi:ATP-dependent RNA helicase DDX24/MAK5
VAYDAPLWAFLTVVYSLQMSSREHEHLTNLSQLRFLVIDEADRMIGQGSFPQLVNIFDAIHQANPLLESVDDSDFGDVEDDEDRLQSLPGVPGEAKVEMLSDILERMQREQVLDEEPEPEEIDDDEYEELQMQQHEALREEEDVVSLPPAPPIQRQTFVYSATLTLPPSASYVAKATKNNRKSKEKKAVTVDGAIAEILEKARASGQTKVVDLTSADRHYVLAPSKREVTPQGPIKELRPSSSSRLPPGLSLFKIECTQRHKDSHLYSYLVSTPQGASGPCLVFCNSIAAVRRVGAILKALRLPVRMLHASMAQVCEISRFVVICWP